MTNQTRDAGTATVQEQVALGFLDAWITGDRVAALALCHDDLVFQGPIERREGATVQLDALLGVSQAVQQHEVKQVISSGDDVVVLYDLTMATPDVVTSIAEVNVVIDGKISHIRAFFDTYPLRRDPPSR